jgi:hypothetical protein
MSNTILKWTKHMTKGTLGELTRFHQLPSNSELHKNVHMTRDTKLARREDHRKAAVLLPHNVNLFLREQNRIKAASRAHHRRTMAIRNRDSLRESSMASTTDIPPKDDLRQGSNMVQHMRSLQVAR